MSHRAKGFSLIELLVTVSLVGILAAIAIPSFTSVIQNSKADTEVSDLQRALNYARLEAINRGVSVQLLPASVGAAWNTELKVVLSSSTGVTLRTVPAMSSGATVSAPNVTYVEFNNLGGLQAPGTAVAMAYALGTISKTINVCLNGRIVLGGSCT
ncbi:general secretion pathway protein GspH [Pseudomonas syringae]|uniref:Type II secretion system protein H n=1 Tax=Pseudomonas syringae TaxID=317 RepID=A0A1C7Z0A6_PSESX|nr:GspH/FimT family pseudopilin [Pseudomonas syringae]OCR21928.1 general secretion pathway protein GspH [Pseudomonas syringae]